MQPLRTLMFWLESHADTEHCLFTVHDLHALFPDLSHNALKTLLSRAVASGHLKRVCRGLYHYKNFLPTSGLALFHAAARLRADTFNYISLETVLSDAGVISQIPIQWISLMSSGRSSAIACGPFGTIEFIHTIQKPQDIVHQLSYDSTCGLWRADVALAIRDMKATHRPLHLINWDIAHEFI